MFDVKGVVARILSQKVAKVAKVASPQLQDHEVDFVARLYQEMSKPERMEVCITSDHSLVVLVGDRDRIHTLVIPDQYEVSLPYVFTVFEEKHFIQKLREVQPDTESIDFASSVAAKSFEDFLQEVHRE